MKSFADRLMYLMETFDMNQTELADHIGISKQTLYKYLHNLSEPRTEIIKKIAIALNTTADYIVGLTNDPTPIIRDESKEKQAAREIELVSNFRRLTDEDKIRIEERIKTKLDD